MVDKSKLKPVNEIINDLQTKPDVAQPTIRSMSLGQNENLEEPDVPEKVPQERPQPEVIAGKALGEKQHRWSITPLYTKNHKYALPTEMLMDENTGSTGIMLADGKYLMGEEGGRLKYHLMQFESDLSYYGMRKSIIKNILFDDDSYIHRVIPGANILDSSIYIDEQAYITKMCISIDFDIYTEVEGTNKLQRSNLDPEIRVEYRLDGGERHKYQCKLSELRLLSEDMHSISIEIENITMLIDDERLISNCYVTIHSILVAVVEE